MLWFNRLFFLTIIAATWGIQVVAQNCNLQISGKVVEQSTDTPLPFVSIYVEETESGTTTDSSGEFTLHGLCPRDYHIQFSHIGCEKIELYINVNSDTIIFVSMAHHSELLNTIEVEGHLHDEAITQSLTVVPQNELSENVGKPLAEIIESISGVSSLQNGSGISKPVIHGMFGNRVTILNNGLPQAGQQWGNDHAPEIDPNMAENIVVVKGVGVIEHGGSGLGGIVMIEPGTISNDPHLHGRVNYNFQTNGNGNALSIKLEQASSLAKWRATVSAKLFGDHRSPDYYLTNTGAKEANGSIQLHKEFGHALHSDLYMSTFNTEIGILRGAHVFTKEDFLSALNRTTPFNTNDKFSYTLDAPKQEVHHHLLKLSNKYFLNENRLVEMHYGAQLNKRHEFDRRRAGRTETPALSLQLWSHELGLKYDGALANNSDLSVGILGQYQDNDNDPETGILPLIPDYQTRALNGFAIYHTNNSKLNYEVGARYDHTAHKVAAIRNREVVRSEHNFDNFSFLGGFSWQPNSTYQFKFNSGFVQRSPEINELYSKGLHQVWLQLKKEITI